MASQSDDGCRPLSRNELRELDRHPSVEIGAHTASHPVLAELEHEEQRREILGGKHDLESMLGHPVQLFSYPHGQAHDFTPETVELVRDSGFSLACSAVGGLVTGDSDVYRLPRVAVPDWDGATFNRRLEELLPMSVSRRRAARGSARASVQRRHPDVPAARPRGRRPPCARGTGGRRRLRGHRRRRRQHGRDGGGASPADPVLSPDRPRAAEPGPRGGGQPAARRSLMASSSLILDDDMEADRRLLAEHDRSHREGADVVLGHMPLHPDSPESFLCPGVAAWADRRAKVLSSSAAPELYDLVSGQMSLRNDVFRRIGGFDTDFTRDGAFGNEDLDLGYRLREAGQQIVFNESAVSRQRYVVTPAQYLRQWRQVGRADVMLARKHPEEADGLFHRSRTERRLDRLLFRWLRPALGAGSPQACRLQGARAEDGQPLLPSRRPRVFPGGA